MNIRKFFKSFVFAFQGIILVVKSEQNFRFHVLAAVIVLLASFIMGLSKWEWIIIVMLICGMFMIELVNASIERVVDLASPELHPLAKQAKDLAAGACLVYAICTIIVGLIIFIPKWSGILF
ncbi:diacylglycerol kinase family protein [Psychrobacillus sp. NEAU-3TGS]|uniref:diacylglycerol kinase family protein n=1 Tax=Psychrobacillus sp. NEAU-3TGS TaxID=2995412 RepID=UPI0024975BA6|nr:diacylglycerol kinase family protein [Psychrobacillus sp. NEAU-3TGS]MDI2588158.1 diacylglycerol kinase family protein [Psychrobacillus sp. NEAU-3TGS]